MTLEQTLSNFDASKENIPVQITSICPTRNIHPETRHHVITKEVQEGRRAAFEVDGVRGLIEDNNGALEVATSLARFKFSAANAYISDIGSGLYTMLTKGQGLFDYREIIDGKTGEAVSARIILSIETLYKALFGPLVNKNGYAIRGAGDIVKEAKKAVMPIINGEIAMPRAYASIQKKKKNGEKIEAVISGEPIHVYRKLTGARDALVIDLDYFFFPAIEKKRGDTANDLFIHQVAGMTTFMQYGRYLVNLKNKKPGNLIGALSARKILLAAQAAYELRYFAPEIVKKNSLGRTNIALRRDAIQDLYPSAVNKKTGWIRFSDFSNAVSEAGQYFRAAMNETGITDILLNSEEEILIPAEDRGAEFPREFPKIVYIKADHPAKDNY
jgi:hypothetical protein